MIRMEAKPVGKPGMPARRERGKRISFWLPDKQAEPMRLLAEANGLRLSTWIRAVAVKKLKRKAS